MDRVGIIAGAGQLPVLTAKSIVSQGRELVIIPITNNKLNRFKEIPCEIHPFGVGQIQKITKKLLELNAKEIIIIGKIEPSILLNPFKVDTTTIKILTQNLNKQTSVIISAVLEHFENAGLTILRQDQFLKHLLPEPGILTKRQPNATQWDEIRTGIFAARKIAELGIGQTVVVKKQMVVAMEAIEGTDKTILRGGELGGKGVVVAKAAAENHDFRIDVPTVGMQTLNTLHAAKASVLAVEAGRTFVMEPEILYDQADKWKITIVAVT